MHHWLMRYLCHNSWHTDLSHCSIIIEYCKKCTVINGVCDSKHVNVYSIISIYIPVWLDEILLKAGGAAVQKN